jgi:hypothetical protein
MSHSVLRAYLGKPVARVRVEDLRRVWSFQDSERDGNRATRGVTPAVLASLCEPNADVLAVWFRAILMRILLQGGLLDQWRKGTVLPDKVFTVLAEFPLPEGPAAADLGAIVAAIE